MDCFIRQSSNARQRRSPRPTVRLRRAARRRPSRRNRPPERSEPENTVARSKPRSACLRVFLNIPSGVAGSGGAVVAQAQRLHADHPWNHRTRGRQPPHVRPARWLACRQPWAGATGSLRTAGHRVGSANTIRTTRRVPFRRYQAPLVSEAERPGGRRATPRRT